MKTKTLSLVSLSILSLIVMMSLASAANISLTSDTTELSQSGGSFIVNLKGDANAEFTINTIEDDGITASPNQTSVTLNSSGDASINVTYTTGTFDFDFEDTYQIRVEATDKIDSDNSDTLQLEFERSKFYEGENEANLKIDELEFEVKEGFGDDEDYWYPFDDVEITFTVENNGKYDVENVEIKVCVLDEDAEKCVFDEDDMDIDNDDFDLDEDDDEDITMTFNVDADDLKGGNTKYTVYVKAVGEIDSDDSNDKEEAGAFDEKSIKIETDDNFAVLNDIEINGMAVRNRELENTLACGSDLEISAEVWNVENDELEDISVLIYNEELGIRETIELDDIDDFDYETLNAYVEIPSNAEEKSYIIEFLIYEDGDILETDEEEDNAVTKVIITIEGSCSSGTNKPSVSASLTSTPKAGETLTVKTIINNIGDETVTYILSVEDYSSWATLEDYSNSLTLVSGESREVMLNFDINDDASGSKTFDIKVTDGATVTTQPVSVTIPENKGFNLKDYLPENNIYLWVIGAINVILILAIILVAIRLSKD
ncbi:MAG: putative S-layer protein [Candidatus Pacearchaeota archaeon]|nr:putative S-layer protein [Candidatus Pacearchaeota archaeon]